MEAMSTCSVSIAARYRGETRLIVRASGSQTKLRELCPSGRTHPIVTVIDGHPHTLSFLGAVQAVPTACLGVANFGQSGDLDDLYEHYGIDVETIIGAALDVMG